MGSREPGATRRIEEGKPANPAGIKDPAESTSKSEGGVDDPATGTSRADAPPRPGPGGRRGRPRRRLLIGGLALVVLAAIILWGVPAVVRTLSTVSTNDAYVNGHVTFVAPRVPGQVARVLAEDNNRVRQRDLLVELDKEPYQVQVALKQAAVETAKADLAAAQA